MNQGEAQLGITICFQNCVQHLCRTLGYSTSALEPEAHTVCELQPISSTHGPSMRICIISVLKACRKHCILLMLSSRPKIYVQIQA